MGPNALVTIDVDSFIRRTYFISLYIYLLSTLCSVVNQSKETEIRPQQLLTTIIIPTTVFAFVIIFVYAVSLSTQDYVYLLAVSFKLAKDARTLYRHLSQDSEENGRKYNQVVA